MTPKRQRLFLIMSTASVPLALFALLAWKASQPASFRDLTREWGETSYSHPGMGLFPSAMRMRSPEFRPDGKFVLDLYVPSEGRWRVEAGRVVLEFEKVDGVPAERFQSEWPKRFEALLHASWKRMKGGSGPGIPGEKSMSYPVWRGEVMRRYSDLSRNPYERPWTLRLRRGVISAEGIHTVLEQEGSDYPHVRLRRSGLL